jgi:hypothetical protein
MKKHGAQDIQVHIKSVECWIVTKHSSLLHRVVSKNKFYEIDDRTRIPTRFVLKAPSSSIRYSLLRLPQKIGLFRKSSCQTLDKFMTAKCLQINKNILIIYK